MPALEAFIRRFGDTYYGDLAKMRLDELKRAEAARQAAEAAKKAEEEARAKAEAERQRLALLRQEDERKAAGDRLTKHRLKILADNERIEAYLKRMRNTTGPLAKYAGIYYKHCYRGFTLPDPATPGLSPYKDLLDLHLLWSEGSTLYRVYVLSPDEPHIHTYAKANRTEPFGRPPTPMYTLIPQGSGKEDDIGFPVGIPAHREPGYLHTLGRTGIFLVARCGLANSDWPDKLRAVLKQWAEVGPAECLRTYSGGPPYPRGACYY